MNAKRLLTLATFAAVSGTIAPLTAQTSEPKVGERVASFEMSWAARTSDQVSVRTEGVAQALLGRKLASRAAVRPLKTPEGAVRRWEVAISEAPTWRLRYLPAYDELRAIDTETNADTTPGRDVGEKEAREIAQVTFKRLAEAGAIESVQYDWSGAEVASTWVGGGTIDGKVSDRVRTEYRITLRRKINGIELANAGLRIAVHASGRLAGLRLGGVSVASQLGSDRIESPKGKGAWLTRKVASEALRARFYKEAVPGNAKADIAWAKVMYAIPDDAKPGSAVVVEPRYVVSYSLQTPSDEGQIVSSRRLILAYSITDPAARPLDLAPATKNPKPDPEPKVAPKG